MHIRSHAGVSLILLFFCSSLASELILERAQSRWNREHLLEEFALSQYHEQPTRLVKSGGNVLAGDRFGINLANEFPQAPPQRGPSLSVILNLVDGTRKPLGDNVPVHIEIDNRFEGHIAKRDAKGPTHQFDGLPWHGNAAAMVIVKVSRIDNGDEAERILTQRIEDRTQRVDLMILPKRRELHALEWQQLQRDRPRIAKLFSIGKPINNSQNFDPYDQLVSTGTDSLWRLLSFLALMETHKVGEAVAIDYIKGFNWDSAMSNDGLSLWVDPNLVAVWTEKQRPKSYLRTRAPRAPVPPQLPELFEDGSHSRWLKSGEDGAWERYPPLDSDDALAMAALRKKYNRPEKRIIGPPNAYYSEWTINDGRELPDNSTLTYIVFNLLFRGDHRRTIAGFDCIELSLLADAPEGTPFYSPRVSPISTYVALWYAAQQNVHWRFNPGFVIRERTALTFFEAATDGNLDVIKTYLSTGTDIESENEAHETALELATKNGREATVAVLLTSGAKPNHHAPLVIAAQKGNLRMVRALLAAGADLAQKREGLTPLLAAYQEGNREIVDFLLLAGASVTEKTDSGMSALELAVKAGKTEVVETLLAQGANANSLLSQGSNDNSITLDGSPITLDGSPILLLAVLRNNVGIVEALLQHGADPNAQKGIALAAATIKGYTKVVLILLNHGADPNLNEAGVLFSAAGDGFTEIVRALLDHGAKANGINPNQITPLMVASFRGHTEIVNLLLAKGADVNVKDKQHGITALIAAAREGTPEVVQALLARGADRSARVEGKTALDFATQEGNREAAAVLKDKAARPLTFQRDFTYSEIGRNPAALRRELLESFLFYDIELLQHEDAEGKKLQLSDLTKSNLNVELGFMVDNILKLYNKKREHISKYLNGASLRQLSASVEVTDEGLAYADSISSYGEDRSGTIFVDAKLLRVYMAASVANSFTEFSGSSDVDKLREIQRQVRNHVYLGPKIESNGPGSYKARLSNPNQLQDSFNKLAVYSELLDLDREVKSAEIQYYGTLLFVLAHELGHLALGHHEKIESAERIESTPNEELCKLRERIELQADQFSALLLGSSFIALSVNVSPVEMLGVGKGNLRSLDSEMLKRYVGYILFFGKSYERLNHKKRQSDECYPSSEARLQVADLAVESIKASEAENIVNKMQKRQDIKDALRSAFPRRYDLISQLLR